MIYDIFGRRHNGENPWEQPRPHGVYSLLEGTLQNNYRHRHKVAALDSGNKEKYIVSRNL